VAAEDQVYPHSTLAGSAVPFDVGDLLGLFLIAFTAASTAAKALPTDADEVLVLYSSQDCVVRFGTAAGMDAALLTADTDLSLHQFVPANTPVSINRFSDWTHVRVIGVSASGSLYIQRYRRWKALTLQSTANKLG
jgi:hypothetical protein